MDTDVMIHLIGCCDQSLLVFDQMGLRQGISVFVKIRDHHQLFVRGDYGDRCFDMVS